MNRALLALSACAVALSAAAAGDLVDHYALRPLRVGDVKAGGWLRDQLLRGKAGLLGHFDEMDPDQLAKPYVTRDWDSSIVTNRIHSQTGYAAEMSADYHYALFLAAMMLDDADLKAKFFRWYERVLALQGTEPDGYLGCFRRWENRLSEEGVMGSGKMFGLMMLVHAATGDERALESLKKGVAWYLSKDIADIRGVYCSRGLASAMIGYSFYTGDRRGVSLAERFVRLIDSKSDWELPPPGGFKRSTGSFTRFSYAPRAYHAAALPGHGISPAVLFRARGETNLLEAAESVLDDFRSQVGFQATYGPACVLEKTAYPSCVGETEYCDIHAWQMYCTALVRATGRSRYADMAERVVFNAGEAARAKDERSVVYLSLPNAFRATQDSCRGGYQAQHGAYSPCMYPSCCAARAQRAIPEFLQYAVLARGDDDLVVAFYGPYSVSTKTAAGSEVTVVSDTIYPFDGRVSLRVSAPKGWGGRLVLRRPEWATGVDVRVDGRAAAAAAKDGWIELPGPWRDGAVEVSLGMEPVVRAQRDCDFEEPLRVVELGPLVFAQPLEEKWTPAPECCHIRHYPKGWTWFDVTCASKPAIYAMPVATAFGPRRIKVERRGSDGYFWERSPVALRVPMVRAASAYGPSPESEKSSPRPVANPVRVADASNEELVTLVPVGCTALRLTCFPLAVE